MREIPPSVGDNLLGMDYDICHYFESNKFLDFKSRVKTSDNSCMFNIELEASPVATDIGEIDAALFEIWGMVNYRWFESSSIRKYKQKAEILFVTVIQGDQFYVTGKATVSGERYSSLAADYETRFIELPNA